MKSKLYVAFSVLMLAVVTLACGGQVATPSTDAVGTAIAQTQVSQVLVQATVNSNTLTAMPATPTPGPTVDYTTMTEDELTALINQSVNEAIAATKNTTTAVTTTTSDGTVTSDEVAYVYDYYYYADYYVQNTEDLINQYYNLYSDLANQMITELNSVETDLNQMNTTLSSIDSSLQQINSTLQQGAAATQEAVAQLNAAAQTAQTNAQALQTKAQDMLSVLQTDQQGRLDQISNIQANNIPTDKIASLQSAFNFIDAAKGAMGDNKLSRDELMNLAQLGKNAQAGFQNFGGANRPGGPDLSQFNGKFDEITTQFARGQIPQARGDVNNFESSLGNRPKPGSGSGPGPGGGPGKP